MEPLPKDKLSQCQQRVFDAMCDAETVRTSICCIVHARGGCGKTRLVLSIAQERFNRGMGYSLLLLCKNSKLHASLKECSLKQDGLQVETLYSLLSNHLFRGERCKNDKEWQQCLDTKSAKTALHEDFYNNIGMVIIDEMQCMDAMHHQAIELVRDLLAPKCISMLGVGDVFQCDKKQKSQDVCFFVDARSKFKHNQYVEFALETNFRHGPKMCAWINTNMSPFSIQRHYPNCWKLCGSLIERFWHNGMVSAKCDSCGELHDTNRNECPAVKHSLKNDTVIVVHDEKKYKSNELLPQTADTFVRDTNAVVIVNGRTLGPFAKKYAHVDTPFGFGGCESKAVTVVGCDYFIERLCGSSVQNNTTNDNWPFQLYCQMFVSCTRASQQLMVVVSGMPFFTMRDTPVGMIPLQPMTQTSSLSSLSSSRSMKRDREEQQHLDDVTTHPVSLIKHRTTIDIRSWVSMLSRDIYEKLTNWLEIDVVSGEKALEQPTPTNDENMCFQSQTVSFRSMLKTIALQIYYTHQVDDKPIPTDWDHEIQTLLQRNYGNHAPRNLDPLIVTWLRKITQQLEELMNCASLKISANFGVQEPCVFYGFTGKIDYFTHCGCIFVLFDDDKLSKLHCFVQFLNCKYKARKLEATNGARNQLFLECFVVDIPHKIVWKISLKEHVHPDFFFSHVVRGIPDFEKQFGDMALFLQKIPIVL